MAYSLVEPIGSELQRINLVEAKLECPNNSFTEFKSVHCFNKMSRKCDFSETVLK
jgi:hypothetical protein